jgi:aryl-alcohol dehydrogenase-like predicted oxidoreductase
VEILPMAKSEQIDVITYSSLGGLLTGKYGVNKRPEQWRLVVDARYGDRYGDHENYVTAEEFTKYAQAHDVKPATLAVVWVSANPAVTAPIIGARDLEQLEESIAATDFNMTPGMYAENSRLSRTHAPATDRGEVMTGKWT